MFFSLNTSKQRTITYGVCMMAGYTYENFLPDEPIVVYTALEGWNEPENLASSDQIGNEMIRTVDQPIYWVLDISAVTLDITTMMMLTNKYTRGEEALWLHPNVRHLCIVSGDELIVQMAAGVQSSELFGKLSVKVFSSRENALAFARSDS